MANGVFFDPAVGGDGSTVTDDDSPTTGLADGGSIIRLVPMFQQIVNIAKWVATQAASMASSVSAAATSASDAAASAAAAAQQANTLTATSTTSLAIGTGSKTLTTQSGEQFISGQFVTIADSVTPSNFMYGQVTSYSGTSLVVNVITTEGSGAFNNWTISLSGIQGATGANGSVNSGAATNLTGLIYGDNGQLKSMDIIEQIYPLPNSYFLSGVI